MFVRSHWLVKEYCWIIAMTTFCAIVINLIAMIISLWIMHSLFVFATAYPPELFLWWSQLFVDYMLILNLFCFVARLWRREDSISDYSKQFDIQYLSCYPSIHPSSIRHPKWHWRCYCWWLLLHSILYRCRFLFHWFIRNNALFRFVSSVVIRCYPFILLLTVSASPIKSDQIICLFHFRSLFCFIVRKNFSSSLSSSFSF